MGRLRRPLAIAIVSTLGAWSSRVESAPPPNTFTCADLTTAKVTSWQGTIMAQFSARTPSDHRYSGGAAYTLRYSNDVFGGHAGVVWSGFTDSWVGEPEIGSGMFEEAFPSAPQNNIDGDGHLISAIGVGGTDLIQVDTAGCRYTIQAGPAMHVLGASGSSAQVAVGFSSVFPVQTIPAQATSLSGSVTLALPHDAFSLTDNFSFTCDPPDDCSTAVGSATFTWMLAPRFSGKLKIENPAFYDTDGLPLYFLSASSCGTDCGGPPRVLGTIAVSGDANDALANLALDVLEGGSVASSADLVPGLEPTLYQPFGTAGRVEVTTVQKLFQFTDAAAGGFDQTNDGVLGLKVRATSARGVEASEQAGAVPKLVLYTQGNRYGPRDANRGGDSWLKPSVKTVLEGLGSGYLWSDMANMNGGCFFPPHKSHMTGNDADGRFADGSIEHDWATMHHHTAATAQRFIDLLNDPKNARVVCIGLLYTMTASDGLWTAIKNVTLNDGRKASDVIRPWHGHDRHFHIRIQEAGDTTTYMRCPEHLPNEPPHDDRCYKK